MRSRFHLNPCCRRCAPTLPTKPRGWLEIANAEDGAKPNGRCGSNEPVRTADRLVHAGEPHRLWLVTCAPLYHDEAHVCIVWECRRSLGKRSLDSSALGATVEGEQRQHRQRFVVKVRTQRFVAQLPYPHGLPARQEEEKKEEDDATGPDCFRKRRRRSPEILG